MLSLKARHACFVPSLKTESVLPFTPPSAAPPLPPLSSLLPSRSVDERPEGINAALSALARSNELRPGGGGGELAGPACLPVPFERCVESVDARERTAVKLGRRPSDDAEIVFDGEVVVVREGGRSEDCEKDLPRVGALVICSI